MNDDRTPEPHDGEDVDTGEPITALALLELRPRPGFMGRLRNKIERRDLAGNFLSMTWQVPWLVLLESLDFVFSYFGRQNGQDGGAP